MGSSRRLRLKSRASNLDQGPGLQAHSFGSIGSISIDVVRRRSCMTELPTKPPLEGVLETSLYVSDLGISLQFYGDVFGFSPLYSDPARMAAMNVSARHVLLLFLRGASLQSIEVPGSGTIPGHDGSGELHLAFAISNQDLTHWRAW